MSRPIRATIDIAALRHNLSVIRKYVQHTPVMAVIKADAYGHGLLNTAQALSTVDAFAVLELEAAVQLREAGFQQPVLLLEGFFSISEIEVLTRYRLSTVIHNTEQLSMLTARNQTKKLDIFLKINTGMNRLGFRPEEGHLVLDNLRQQSYIGSITLMTHFACADDPIESDYINQQLKHFAALYKRCGNNHLPRTLANSAAILCYPQTYADWVRPGLLLYGVSPLPDKTGSELGLQPAMTLTSQIIATQHLNPHDRLGYGGKFVTDRPIRVGIVAAGYADGYPRHAPTGTPVLVNGQRTRLVGRVSMDMLSVDLEGIRQVGIGSTVTLWGKGLPVEDIANPAETIGYELLVALSTRVKRTLITPQAVSEEVNSPLTSVHTKSL